MPKVQIENIEKFPHDDLVYLVDELSGGKRLFVCNGDIIYASLSLPSDGDNRPAIKTDYLELCLGINLQPILQDGSPGDIVRYDFVRLFGSASNREKLAFLDICESHAKSRTAQTLQDFFYSVSLLFSSTSEKSKKGAIGLFGELSVIEAFVKHGIDTSSRWQINGLQSKYDFSFAQFNCEVKTTSSKEPIALIKHSQLFNQDNNYLVFLRVEVNSGGVSVAELAKDLLSSSKCFNGLHEQIILENRLLQIRDEDLHKQYQAASLNFYSADSINPFPEGMPPSVTSATYSLNLLRAEPTEIEYLCGLLL